MYLHNALQVRDGATVSAVPVKDGERRLFDDDDGTVWVLTNTGRTKWHTLNTYAIQPAPNQPALGYRRLVDIRRVRVQDVTDEDARAMGYPGVECAHCGGDGWYESIGIGMGYNPDHPDIPDPIPVAVQKECYCYGGYEVSPADHWRDESGVEGDVWLLTWEAV